MSNWTEERTALLETGLDKTAEISRDEVISKADELDVSPRSISSKLRKLGYEVEKVAAATKKWSEAEEAHLRNVLESNPGTYTYRDLEGVIGDGKHTWKSIQGKVLSMELTDKVMPTEKPASVKTYSEEEEATFIKMAQNGSSIEAIASALGRTLQSVRGKALSLLRQVEGFKIPHQETKVSDISVDPYKELGDAIATMTVAEIAEKIEKTERGVKTTLTRRGLTCADYDGAAKKAKREEHKEAA